MRSQKLLEIRRNVIKVLKRLAKELNARIYLFGSYARGDHTVESDVDIVVVSDIFKGMSYVDRVVMVRMKLPPEIGFDIVPLTVDEFERKKNTTFFKYISRYWVEISPQS